jgi:dienelactone hydrolase
MRLKSIALALPLILAACASGPHEDVATAKPPIDKSLRMATAYPVALVNIAVEDPKAKSIPAALFQPAGTGPFPAVVILSGCAGVNADVSIVGRANRDYMSKGIVTLVVDSFTPRGLAEVCMAGSETGRGSEAHLPAGLLTWSEYCNCRNRCAAAAAQGGEDRRRRCVLPILSCE